MIKNYSKFSFGRKMNSIKLTPKKETVSFILNFSKSISIVKSVVVNEIRFDKN